MNKLIELQANEVEELNNENIVLIDLRRKDEWEITGVIKNALKLTFFDEYGNYDLEKWMNEFEKHVTSHEQKFVLLCAHGNRTTTIGNFLIEQGYVNTSHLKGGMATWLQERKETIKV